MKKYLLLTMPFLLAALFALSQPGRVFAQQEEVFRAEITEVTKETTDDQGGQSFYQQILTARVLTGSDHGKTITIDTGRIPVVGQPRYHAGDQVLVTENRTPKGETFYYINDYVRTTSLFWLFAIFVTLVVFVGGLRGVSSLLGLVGSFVIIFTFVLPQIDAGRDPVLIAILASGAIVPVTFYLSHGINKKTSVAVISTVVSLLLTGLLAKIFIDAAHLTGYSSDEASFLQIASQGSISIRGLLLAGIIIGTLGILDDITVSQASVVNELRSANPDIDAKELFVRSLRVGRDHIASLVNTLVLVYTGAALPLLLLFINNPQPFSQVINYEIIAEEIVRTLVGSIGLVAAVPITTILAVRMIKTSQSGS